MTGEPPRGGVGNLKVRALERAQPLTAHLELTYRCNWHCAFCYNARIADEKTLGAAEWEAVLDDLRTLGTLWVTLTGGEPLVHPEFLAIVRAARRRAFATRVFTNASLVDEAVADELARLHLSSAEVSLHGATAVTHDRTTGRPGSFEATMRGVGLLRSRAVPVMLKTPLTRLNEAELDAVIGLARELDVPLRVDPLLSPRDGGDMSPIALSPGPESVDRLMARLREERRLPKSDRDGGRPSCGLGRITLAVDPEGDVFPCIQWRSTKLGNVRRTRLAELWASSSERARAAEVATAAGNAVRAQEPAVAHYRFCPALNLLETGDPLRPADRHVEVARAAERAREETQ